MKLDESVLKDIYVELKEDYIGFWIIFSIIDEFYQNSENINEKVSNYIFELARDPNVKMGLFERDKDSFTFVPWDVGYTEKCYLFLNEWRKIEYRVPDIGDVVYLTTDY